MRATGACGPCVHVFVYGQGMGRGGRPQLPQDSQGRKCPAWGEHGMAAGTASPPKPPAAGASHARLPLKRRQGWAGSWVVVRPCQAYCKRCTATGFLPCNPPNQALTPFLDTPQPHPGSAHPTSTFAVAAAPSLPALGKRWWPDPAARCGQGQLCLNMLRCQSRNNRARGMHQLGLHAQNTCSCWRTSPSGRSSVGSWSSTGTLGSGM